MCLKHKTLCIACAQQTHLTRHRRLVRLHVRNYGVWCEIECIDMVIAIVHCIHNNIIINSTFSIGFSFWSFSLRIWWWNDDLMQTQLNLRPFGLFVNSNLLVPRVMTSNRSSWAHFAKVEIQYDLFALWRALTAFGFVHTFSSFRIMFLCFPCRAIRKKPTAHRDSQMRSKYWLNLFSIGNCNAEGEGEREGECKRVWGRGQLMSLATRLYAQKIFV